MITFLGLLIVTLLNPPARQLHLLYARMLFHIPGPVTVEGQPLGCVLTGVP